MNQPWDQIIYRDTRKQANTSDYITHRYLFSFVFLSRRFALFGILFVTFCERISFWLTVLIFLYSFKWISFNSFCNSYVEFCCNLFLNSMSNWSWIFLSCTAKHTDHLQFCWAVVSLCRRFIVLFFYYDFHMAFNFWMKPMTNWIAFVYFTARKRTYWLFEV